VGGQPVRQARGPGRTPYAPRRTAEDEHLGALGTLSRGGSLQPEKFGKTAMRAEVCPTGAGCALDFCDVGRCARRSSAELPFVLRCGGPQQIMQIGLRPRVQRDRREQPLTGYFGAYCAVTTRRSIAPPWSEGAIDLGADDPLEDVFIPPRLAKSSRLSGMA
jgi:hypothetical protein